MTAALAAVVAGADQASKTWALHRLADGPVHLVWRLRLVLTFNSGAAFSLGRGVTPFLVAGVVVLLVVLLFLGRSVASLPAALALGLVLGGAVGNLSDRVVRHHHGAVIDFIDLRPWPTFNLADTGVVCGAVLLVLTSGDRKRRAEAP